MIFASAIRPTGKSAGIAIMALGRHVITVCAAGVNCHALQIRELQVLTPLHFILGIIYGLS